jgi:hypothetical protein
MKLIRLLVAALFVSLIHISPAFAADLAASVSRPATS